MKKSLLAALILLAIIAALPIIGNTFIKQTIDEKLSTLESFGIKVKNDASDSSYFSSSRHIEFLLEDSQKFVTYISQYSDKQIPPYVNALLDGVKVGADLKYSNLPFAKAVEIDLYPLELSHELSVSLKQDDAAFSDYIDKFLQSKGVLYHINYNFLNSDFKGYIKDIKESYTLQDGMKMDALLMSATFKGNGELLAPEQITTAVKEMHLDVVRDNQTLNILLEKFKGSSNFESQNTYITSAELGRFDILLNGVDNDVNMTIAEIKTNISSNDQADDAQLHARASYKSLTVHSQTMNLKSKDFTVDVALNDLNKEIYTKFTALLAKNKAQATPQNQQEFQESIIDLLAKGLVLNIAEFSLANLNVNGEDFKGYKISSTVTMKEDAALKSKMQMSPLAAISNLDIKTNIKISKKIYNEAVREKSMFAAMRQYAKEKNGNYLFEITFIDAKLIINGQTLN